MSDTKALATVESRAVAHRPGIMGRDELDSMFHLSKALVSSGFLPKAIQRPEQALAVIIAGQELGIPPMRALRMIHIIEGKPTLSSELMLERFRAIGGRAQWVESTATKAVLKLTDPSGDEHVETITIEDANKAGITGKDNWRKYPKSMLRARAIAFGIRALGRGDGLYDPDELGAVTDEHGGVVSVAAVEVKQESTAATEHVERGTKLQFETINQLIKDLAWTQTQCVEWRKANFPGVSRMAAMSIDEAARAIELLTSEFEAAAEAERAQSAQPEPAVAEA